MTSYEPAGAPSLPVAVTPEPRTSEPSLPLTTAHRRVAGSPLSPFAPFVPGAPGAPGWPAGPVAPAGPRFPSTCSPAIARLALRSARLAIRSVEASFFARLVALVAWGAPNAGASMEAQSSAATLISTRNVVRRERRIARRYPDRRGASRARAGGNAHAGTMIPIDGPGREGGLPARARPGGVRRVARARPGLRPDADEP